MITPAGVPRSPGTLKRASSGDGARSVPVASRRPMLTSQGFGLIAELFAAVLLVAALTGFFIRRSQPWLVGAAIAFTILIVAVTIIIEAST